MKRYKLLKDLPPFKAGYLFEIDSLGRLYTSIAAYTRSTSYDDAEASIDAHPNEWKTYLGVED